MNAMTAKTTPRTKIMSRKLPILFLSLALASFLLTGCSDSTNGQDPEPGSEAVSTSPASGAVQSRTVRVTTMTIEPGTFEDIVPITGSVMAPQDASLSAQAAGTLTEIAESGTRLAEGDVVARLDDRLIRAALEQARASLSSAKSQARLAEETFRRQEPLYQDSIISALEYENVLTQRNQALSVLAQAEAAVAQAEQQLENTLVRAPFPGVIEERFAERGEQLMPGTPVARIVNTRVLKVVAGVPETFAADIRTGTPVDLSFRAYSEGDRTETVSFVGSVINPQNRTFQIEINIDNPSGILKPAMIADVKLTRRVLTDQVVIPQTAILRDENGTSVYLAVESDGRTIAQRRSIELGPSYAGRTVVSSGLSFGDHVITAGQTSVAEGDQISIAN